MERLKGLLKERSISFREDVSAKSLCTFFIGGNAQIVVEPQCQGELIDTLRLCLSLGLSYAVLGNGSNVVFADGEIETVLIRTQGLSACRMQGSVLVASAGAMLPRLAFLAATAGYDDLAFLCGVPGTLGGGVFMNAGAEGQSIADVLCSVTYFDVRERKIRTIDNKEWGFSYRNSPFQQNGGVVLEASLSLRSFCQRREAERKICDLLKKRNASQPLEFHNAGCAFRRLREDLPIGRVLDELGFKGMRIGDAAISQKHAGFIVNLGAARAADVIALMHKVQDITERRTGIRPMPEYRFIPSENELFVKSEE